MRLDFVGGRNAIAFLVAISLNFGFFDQKSVPGIEFLFVAIAPIVITQ